MFVKLIGFWAVYLCISPCSQAQAPPAFTHWVNQQYVQCLDSGKAVCDCQQKNHFLMASIDTLHHTITWKHSVYYSWETLTEELQQTERKNVFKSRMTLENNLPVVVRVNKQKLILQKSGHTFTFVRFLEITHSQNKMEAGEVLLGALPCQSLQQYTISSKEGSSLLLPHDSLSGYLAKGQVGIHCSDDFHYNEMVVKHSDGHLSSYFLRYYASQILLFPQPERGRGEEVQASKLVSYQVYDKKKLRK